MAEVRQITLRNPPEDLVRCLREVAANRNESLNGTILRILQDAVGLEPRRERLRRYATWTPEDLRDFEDRLSEQRGIDEDLWR